MSKRNRETSEFMFALLQSIHYESSNVETVYWTMEEAIEEARKFVKDEEKRHQNHKRYQFKFRGDEEYAEFEGYGHSYIIKKVRIGMKFEDRFKDFEAESKKKDRK